MRWQFMFMGFGLTNEVIRYLLLKMHKRYLKDVGYNSSLIGFSWDSDTKIDFDGEGWNIAKIIAKGNGPKLAQFLLDLKNYCIEHSNNNIEIRLVGHSLGSRVILSALNSLDNNNEWKSSHFKIITVNLLGGAVDNYEVLKNNNDIPIISNIKAFYGDAIQNQVINFYNMYNFEDNDHDGCDLKNLFGVCTINGVGDNHLGYIGFRDSDNSLMNHGAIDKVINTWNFS